MKLRGTRTTQDGVLVSLDTFLVINTWKFDNGLDLRTWVFSNDILPGRRLYLSSCIKYRQLGSDEAEILSQGRTIAGVNERQEPWNLCIKNPT